MVSAIDRMDVALPTTEFARELRSWSGLTAVPPARVLAALFGRTFVPDPRSRVLLYHLHKDLLRRTLRHAHENTAFYAAPVYAEWTETGAEEPPDLSLWPILQRADLIERFDDFLARDVSFGSCCHTSGSTGPSLSIYKSSQELGYLWSYYERLLTSAAGARRPTPLILSLPNFYHGAPIRLPTVGKVFVSGVTDDLLLGETIKVLERSYSFPGHDTRISVISGLSFQIQFFTNFLLEQGYDPRAFGIRSINVIGSYTSRTAWRFLAESWGALVLDRFTLTESVGGAGKCLRCGLYHLDPHVIGEVVDPDTLSPLERGLGYLVLTQLYPFVQMQPLVRYLTGDLVRRVDSDCSSTLSFEFLGKVGHCIGWKPDGRTEWLLFSADLFEIIDALPDVRRIESFAGVEAARDRSVASPPIFSRTASPEGSLPFVIDLKLELRYSPHVFPDRLAELRERIVGSLRAASTSLGRRLDERSVALNVGFVGPGGLGKSFSMKV